MSLSIRPKVILTILLALALMGVSVQGASCWQADQVTCGAAIFGCQGYAWTNGTCQLGTCPVNTYWSNSTSTCIDCMAQNSSVCNSFCAPYGFFFSNLFFGCLKCPLAFGSNCLTCNQTQCLTCANGTSLAGGNTICVASTCTLANCLSCFNSTYCQGCETGYKVIAGTCTCSINNCKICSGQYCLQCLNGFKTDSTLTTCVPVCIPNCASCNTSQTCAQCQTNYTYNAQLNICQYNCSLIDSNCLNCPTSFICSQCATGFSLNFVATTCVQACSDTNCLVCTGSVSVCTQCITGWKVNSTNICERDLCSISNCLSCSGPTICETCANNTVSANNGSACVPSCAGTIMNCISCTNNATCQQCAPGYRLSNNSCLPWCNINNCMVCGSTTTCSACAPGTVIGLSSLTCDWNCGIVGCLTCSSATTCRNCLPGYTLNSGSTRCQANCPRGYYLKSGVCTLCQAGFCQQCSSNGKCIECRELFYLNQTDLTCARCSSIDAFCYTCMPTAAVCTSCLDGFALYNGKCVLVTATCSIANCAACYVTANTTTCLACSPGFSLAATNLTCTAITCPSQQILVGSRCTCGVSSYWSNSQCLPCTANCITCNPQACSQCAIGYFPNGNQCNRCSQNCQYCYSSTSCISCRSNFILQNGACDRQVDSKVAISVTSVGALITCPAGCMACDVTTNGIIICLVPVEGYIVVFDEIVKCPEICRSCSGIAGNSSISNCLSCYTGYYLSGGNCKKCSDANAVTCTASGNSSFSLTCAPGYISIAGVCTACAGNCLKCANNKADSCDVNSCGVGFSQFGGNLACVACFNGCATCSSDPETCTSCIRSQYLSGTTCLPCSSNCIVCSSNVTCITCAPGYAVMGSGACGIAPALPCVNYNSNLTCIACDTNYLLVNGSCTFSSTCNSSKTCRSCNFNQYLSNGTCLACPNLPNCASCSMTNSSLCFSCNSGFYLDGSNQCVACSSSCSSCTSSTFCTGAAVGFFVIVNFDGSFSGSAQACASPCFTCAVQPTLCTSCGAGYTLVGSQCVLNFRHQVSLVSTFTGISTGTLSRRRGFFFLRFGRFQQEAATKLRFPSLRHFHRRCCFKRIRLGSLATEFDINGDSVNRQDISNLNNMESVSVLKLDVATMNGSEDSGVNLAVVLGVVIPLGVIAIGIAAVLFYRRFSETSQTELPEDEKGFQMTPKTRNAPAMIEPNKKNDDTDEQLNKERDLE